MAVPAEKLPWRSIGDLTPTIGGPPTLVCSGDQIVFAYWRYSWSLDETIDTSVPLWTDGRMPLHPQPHLYLPLSLPDGTPWPLPES